MDGGVRVAIDIETNSLVNPTEIWCICAQDIDTDEWYIFKEVTSNALEKERFKTWFQRVSLFVGHNFLGFDYLHIASLLGCHRDNIWDCCRDTFILSKLIDYPRDGHSIEDYGKEFGLEKGKFNDFSKLSEEMVDYCRRDVEICRRIFAKYSSYCNNSKHLAAIRTEQHFQLICNDLHKNGFAFNVKEAEKLLVKVSEELTKLDEAILKEFPPKLRLIREVHPVVTQHGTLHKKDFRFVKDGDLSQYNGGPFSRCSWIEFNPGSVKQVVEELNKAGWQPTDKTKTHIEVLREIAICKNKNLDFSKLSDKLKQLEIYGWKINETNLSTLPSTAPRPARTLATRIMYESRRRTLTEWLALVDESGRIHGSFQGIGAWTHRMSHQKPNTANIPNEFDNNGKIKLLGAALRKLWIAPKKRLLVGVDAEGIQLRIFAHLVNSPELIDALVKGRKEDKTDPHSYNKGVLGDVCKTRTVAKRYLYALFLGAGKDKLRAILESSAEEADVALRRLLDKYPGFAELKSSIIPRDAKRGYFVGLDGRTVKVPGEDLGTRKHLMMSGYLQCGEVVVMKKSTLKWYYRLPKEAQWLLVNFVHDEWQTELTNNVDLAIQIAKAQCDALREVGEELKLNCPLAGSYWNDDLKDYTIGTNWKVTH